MAGMNATLEPGGEEKNPIAEEVNQHFVLKKLQERAWRLESENKELRAGNELLHTQYTSQRETQSEILRNLNASIEENCERIEEQGHVVERLEQKLRAQRLEFEEKLEVERRNWETKVIGLQKENEELERRLREIDVFKANKASMEGELEKLQLRLQEQAENRERDLATSKDKMNSEREHIKKDMLRKVREMREMLRAKTKDQLDSTTKRTILENEQMVTELQFQNKEAERLLDNNARLVEENAQLRKNLAIHRDLENELARRTHTYQKLIKKMEQRQKAELDQLPGAKGGPTLASIEQLLSPSSVAELSRLRGGEDRSRFDVSRELPSASDGIAAFAAAAHQSEEAEKAKQEIESTQNTIATVRHEFSQYRRDHDTLTQLQDQSTRLIIAALYELKNQKASPEFPSAAAAGGEMADVWQLANMTPKQKDYFFRALFEKLSGSLGASLCAGGPDAHRHSTSFAGGDSTTSLPSIPSPRGARPGVSHFLWSVATQDGPSATSDLDMCSKGVQTETLQTESAPKENLALWTSQPQSRSALMGPGRTTPSTLGGGAAAGYQWGPRTHPRKRYI